MIDYSNTTFVKVKCWDSLKLVALVRIQIQHLLKLNITQDKLVEFVGNSNTTFVKVKLYKLLMLRQ